MIRQSDALESMASSDVTPSTFLYTDPPSAVGFWIPLEKCTPENGALSFLPGSHLTAPIYKRFVRAPGGGTGFEQLLDPAEVKQPQGEYIMECTDPGNVPFAYAF